MKIALGAALPVLACAGMLSCIRNAVPGGAEPDPGPARYAPIARRLVQGCMAGDEQSCDRIRRLERSLETLESCDRGSLFACRDAALLYAEGGAVPKDPGRAGRLAKRHCELNAARCEQDGDAEACLGASWCALVGFGAPKSREAADRWRKAYYRIVRRGCEAGDFAACKLYSVGCGAFADAPERPGCRERYLALAREAIRARCAAGEPEACFLAAALDGPKGAAHGARGVSLLEEACRAGKAEACLALARLRAIGEHGLDRDPDEERRYCERSKAICRQACEQGDAGACFEAGMHELNGYCGERRFDAAAGLFARACELGHALGCHDAGSMYLFRTGVEVDLGKADAFAGKACALGVDRSCARARIFGLLARLRAESEQQAALLASYAFEKSGSSYTGDLAAFGSAAGCLGRALP